MVLARDEALDRARAVLGEAEADEVEVTLEECAESFVRFAAAGPTQCADRERLELSVRVRFAAGSGTREARASCGSLAPEAVRATLERAQALARLQPAAPDEEPLGGPVELEGSTREAFPSAPGEAEAELVQAAVGETRSAGFAPAGLLLQRGSRRTLVNSAGRAVQGATRRAEFALTASGEGGSGWGETRGRELDLEGARKAAATAVEKARANQAPRTAEPAETTVVLEPAAVSALLLFAAWQGFGAQEVAEESSFLCGRQGERLFSPAFSLRDDPGHPALPGYAFDGEGSPRRAVTLVDRGTPTGPVTDRRWAKRLGLACTGHGRRQPSDEGPRPENLVVAPGEQGLEELIGGVEKGLLVTQFHYTNVIDPRELLLTGMTRNGTFAIEKGRVVGSVKNLRFTQSLVEGLAQLSGIGSEPRVAGSLFGGDVVTPALRLERFRFTSGTDF